MMPHLPRTQVQFISLLLFALGAFVLIAGGWQSDHGRAVGISMMAGSIWFVIINESILLTKVQNEMHGVLEKLSIKREREIEDLLLFLKQSQLRLSPFESIAGAEVLCGKLDFPAMVLTTHHQIIKANSSMHKLLGWSEEELNGKPVHRINNALVMSKIGELAGRDEVAKKDSMITQYVYVHKSGRKIYGQMGAVKIGEYGFFVVFHPSDSCLISYEEIRKLAK